jgi:hypothetical protein
MDRKKLGQPRLNKGERFVMPKAQRQSSPKQVIRIETVGRKARQIDGRLRDGAQVKVGLYEITPSFRWPTVGEYWTVSSESGHWMLGNRLEVDPDADYPIESMDEGELRLDAEKVTDAKGREVVATDNEGISNNQVPTWDAADEEWKPQTISTIAGSDKNYVWVQNALATDWGDPLPGDPSGPKYVTHNLGKRPAVTVVDFGGNQIEVSVKYTDNNRIQISTTVPSNGSAYFN